MLEKKHIGAAIPKKACFICAKLVNQEMIMNNKPTEASANKVKKLHGAVTGFLDEPCEECQEAMKRGVIVITMNSKKTKNPKNPFRTGGFFLIKDDYIETLLKDEPDNMLEIVMQQRFMFMEHSVAEHLGFFKLEDTNKDGNKQESKGDFSIK